MEKSVLNILDGLILSDLHIKPSGNISGSFKYEEFAKSIIKNLNSLAPFKIRSYENFDKRTNKINCGFGISSKTNGFLKYIRRKWYNKYGKIVPYDLNLSNLCLLWWYLGDGHLHRRKSRPNYREIILSTDGFSKKDVKFLQRKLKQFLEDKNILIDCNNRICITRSAIKKFAEHIGDCPVDCYKYKFEFGNYLSSNYLKESYTSRPLSIINTYRKKFKVREIPKEVREKIIKEVKSYGSITGLTYSPV